jgi:hypothetical protein
LTERVTPLGPENVINLIFVAGAAPLLRTDLQDRQGRGGAAHTQATKAGIS